jgi:hypothetical protein
MAWKNLFHIKSCPSKQNRQHVFVRDILRNGIPRVCLFCIFFSKEQNSEHFSPLRNGSERNSESFLFRGMVQNGIREFASIFVPWYRIPGILFLCWTVRKRNSESFLFRGTARIPPEQSNFRLFYFRRIIICQKLPNLILNLHICYTEHLHMSLQHGSPVHVLHEHTWNRTCKADGMLPHWRIASSRRITSGSPL